MKYEKPDIMFVLFGNQDVITSSPNVPLIPGVEDEDDDIIYTNI